MKSYETLVIYAGDVSAPDIVKRSGQFEGFLKARGAENIKVDNWGRREIAYTLKKHNSGHYVCFAFETAKTEVLAEVTAHLRIAEKVLKFQTHRVNLPKRKFRGSERRTPRDMGDERGFEY